MKGLIEPWEAVMINVLVCYSLANMQIRATLERCFIPQE